jgi:hypothetical protein
MGFFRKLVKNVKDKAALQDQSVSIERLPKDGGAMIDPAAPDAQIGAGGKGAGGIGSILGGRTRRKELMPVPMPVAPPAPTGIEALIRPQRTDPNNQQDMQRLMDMQRQTFRGFLAPPPVVRTPTIPYLPIDGGDLGLPMNPGTPAPGGVIMEPGGPMFEDQLNYAPSTKQIQDILDNLPKGVGVGGIGNIPIPDIPYEIPQLTAPQELLDSISNPATIPLPFQLPPELEQQIAVPQLPIDLPLQLPQIENVGLPAIQLPFEIPALPQVAMMPSVSPVAMPAMRLARAEPNNFGAIGRGER